ncbi:uncharacterized protein LOC119737366 [Patiria miniata]|uniref:Uncharacterized protein n=1 Tax=Patiria miniata TaxID=46514 RepID=A0A914AV88_PATMI|nr:uncharacterized protein LOC119737366 [Patiria miniata]XP_038067600.1 uncharacterized protein LOC119737366 [Patiria miniata]
MARIALVLVALLNCFTSLKAYTDPQCSNYDHQTYGCVGECISTTSCPGGKYISNLCPTQPAGVKCCFTADSDIECADYNHWQYGKVGHCISTSQCPGNTYISNLCPTKSAGIKCCFKKPTDTCSASGSCSQTVKSLACQVQSHSRITLLANNKHLNPLGADDGADAASNIRDTCNGKPAKLSSYCCSSGCAPGGSVCLSAKALQYLLDVANAGYNFQVNAITGACHSTTSRHYRGTAVDLQIFSGSNYAAWMSKCSAAGAAENLGPGNAGHSTHTHCAFYS